MKKVTCNQMKVVAASDLKHINGGAGDSSMSRSEAVQTALSGDRGCVAGARDAQQASGQRR